MGIGQSILTNDYNTFQRNARKCEPAIHKYDNERNAKHTIYIIMEAIKSCFKRDRKIRNE